MTSRGTYLHQQQQQQQQLHFSWTVEHTASGCGLLVADKDLNHDAAIRLVA
jgi:hypothetical protein